MVYFLDFPLHMVTETKTGAYLTVKYKIKTDTMVKMAMYTTI